MGQRANFEEKYTGESLQGNYIAGSITRQDPRRLVEEWLPEYFAKVLNAPNWIGISVIAGGEELDLHTARVISFRRELNMKQGYLERSFVAELKSGTRLQLRQHVSEHGLDEIGAIRYAVIPLNFQGTLTLTPYLDGNVVNRDANYDEKFWMSLKPALMETPHG